MAVILTKQMQVAFYKAVFPENVCNRVEDLIDKGCVFEQGLFTLKVTFPSGSVSQIQLKLVGTSALAKKIGIESSLAAEKLNVLKWLGEAYLSFFGIASASINGEIAGSNNHTTEPVPPAEAPIPELETAEEIEKWTVILVATGPNKINTIKEIRIHTGVGLYEAKKATDSAPCSLAHLWTGSEAKAHNFASAIHNVGGIALPVKASEAEQFVALYKTSMVVEPTPTGVDPDVVVPLREANYVGQQCKGTDPGSVYYCIALNPRVKVAARIREGKKYMSLRVETVNPMPDELLAVKKAVKWNDAQQYGSIHMDYDDIPVGRVIGAFLMGMDIGFSSQVQSGKDLVKS